MTPQQAKVLHEELNLREFFSDHEEVECMEQNNPEGLEAYRAFARFAGEPTDEKDAETWQGK